MKQEHRVISKLPISLDTPPIDVMNFTRGIKLSQFYKQIVKEQKKDFYLDLIEFLNKAIDLDPN